jgi:ADP-ribose pyrophosphatase
VTRWKRDENGAIVKNPVSKKPILQFVSIRRLDTNEWAIPGGMCDPGEKISQTLKREFMEEATDSTGANKSSIEKIEAHLNSLFENGVEIHRGYVDDPRNTDNSWMETIAYNFHDEDDSVFKEFALTAGDDAGSVTWMDLDSKLKLYASHKYFVEKATKLHDAHW